MTHHLTEIELIREYKEFPVILSDMQTLDGGDTSVVSCLYNDTSAIEVRIEEEQSWDSEMWHTSEIVGYMVVAAE